MLTLAVCVRGIEDTRNICMTRKYMEQREKGSEERGSKGCALSVAEKQGGSVLSVQMVFLK